jgi:FAD synthetase
MKKVLVFGTFDIFHEGHKDFLRQAREHGDFLRVVVARDETVKQVKNRQAKNNQKQRMENVKTSGLADEVAAGNIGDKYAVIKEYEPDIICLGYDQEFFTDGLENKLKFFGLEKTKIIRLKPYKPEVYKSSKL